MAALKQKVGESIKQLRLSKGLRQKEVGELLGISESTYNRYESGNQNLTLDSLESLAKAMNCEVKITFVKS